MSLISWFRKMTDGSYAQHTGIKAVEEGGHVKDDRVSHVVAVLGEDGDWFDSRAVSSLADHIARAGQRTGAHAIERMVGMHGLNQLMSRGVTKDRDAARAYVQQQVRDWEERTGRTALPPGGSRADERMIGDPERLLTPFEQAEGRAMHTPLADNVDYWTMTCGAERAAELVGRLYDENGELLVKPDAAPPKDLRISQS